MQAGALTELDSARHTSDKDNYGWGMQAQVEKWQLSGERTNERFPQSYQGPQGPTRGTRNTHSILIATRTDGMPDIGDH